MIGLLQISAIGGGFIVLLISILASLLRDWWVANLFANFRFQLCVMGLVVLALAIGFESPVLALIGATIVLVNGAIVFGAIRPPRGRSKPAADGPTLRVMSLNLLCENHDSEAVFRQVEQVRPDVLLLQEVGRHWSNALGRLRTSYPHLLQLPREGAPFGRHGPLLLSRHSIVATDPQTLGGSAIRLAAARLAVGDLTLWVASVHASNPSDRAGFASQCRELEELAAWVNGCHGPVVLGGDLNATSTASQVHRLLAATGLILDQQAVPLQALASTFPARLPLLGLKIDHILVRGMTMPRAWTLPRTSSDHRGVVAEVVFPKSS